MLKVNTIYPAFMGEVNKHGIGSPCTFVRLSGCNLRCYKKTKGILCDTPEALEVSSGKDMMVSEILYKVSCFGINLVCLTGGEPLMQDVSKLLTKLSSSGCHVVVETNGSKSIAPYRHIRNVSFVVDVKSGSSGESEKMLNANYSLLDKDDFIKFVVDTEEDYNEFSDWVFSHDYLRCNIAVGLFWGSKLSYEKLMQNIKRTGWPMPIHLNMQIHKMACMYDCYKDNLGEIMIPKEL